MTRVGSQRHKKKRNKKIDERTIITADVAYACERRPSSLTDEQKLKVFENEVMRKIF